MIGPGSVLAGRYELGQRIGKGGFAVVYLAKDTVLQREVAVKVITPGDLDDVPEGQAANKLLTLLEEARFVARHRHPNILDVYDFGQIEDEAFLVMPYAANGTLLQKIRQGGKMAFELAGIYLDQMASALDYAHSLGVIHRDIKPQNILMFNNQQVAVSDFGIAKVLTDTSGFSNTRATGTPSYMAPEQFSGRVSKSSDIYSLAVVLYQMLTNTLPFKADSQAGLMYNVLNQPPPSLRQLRPDAPPLLEDLLLQAMSKDPSLRPHSAGELARRYHAALRGSSQTSAYYASQTTPGIAATDNTTPLPGRASGQQPIVPGNTPPSQPNYQNTPPSTYYNTPPSQQNYQNTPPTPQPQQYLDVTPLNYYQQQYSEPVVPVSPPQARTSRFVLIALFGLVVVVVGLAVAVSLLIFNNSRAATPTPQALVVTPTPNVRTTDTLPPLPSVTPVQITVVVTAPPVTTNAVPVNTAVNSTPAPDAATPTPTGEVKVNVAATTAPPTPLPTNTPLPPPTTVRPSPTVPTLLTVNGRPVRGRLAFTYEDPVNATGIKVRFLENGVEQTLFPAGSGAQAPAWSPDGKQLVYYNNTSIFVANEDGSNPQKLPINGRSPSWSPDGSRIVYTGLNGGIFVADANGQNANQLTNEGAQTHAPVFSPDGNKIAYGRLTNGLWQIWVIDADGQNPQQLTTSGENARFPSWSPDGRQIVYHIATNDASPVPIQIWLMNADGSGQKALTRRDNSGRPFWSKDNLIFFHSYRGNPTRASLYVMLPDGSEQKPITNGDQDYYGAVWRP